MRGVLAICLWSTTPEAVEKSITLKGKFAHLVRFADEHQLAVIGWTNPKGYQTGVSGDEMNRAAYQAEDRVYDRRARNWRNGYRRLCKTYHLPEKNLMAYGMSGGAQTLHRLALRVPEYFFAVHIHINSSYDRMVPGAENVLWLVTTGTREYGYPAGMRFYERARELGYGMIFRAEENLGHSDSGGTKRVSIAFFDYCVKFLPDARETKWNADPKEIFTMMKYPAYIGDHINGEAFKPDVAAEYMDKEVMVPLPTEEIAKAWGIIVAE